jgi:hypothetical protein
LFAHDDDSVVSQPQNSTAFCTNLGITLILQPLVGEIGWAHNFVIMGKCKDPLEREFYLRMIRKFGCNNRNASHIFIEAKNSLRYVLDEGVETGQRHRFFHASAVIAVAFITFAMQSYKIAAANPADMTHYD